MSSSFRIVILGIGLASAGGWFVYNQFFRVEELVEPNVIRRPKMRATSPVVKTEEPRLAEALPHSQISHSTEIVSSEKEAEIDPPRHSTEVTETEPAPASLAEKAIREPAYQDASPTGVSAAVPTGTTDPDKLAWRQRLFAMLDLDGDGQLVAAEIPERWRNELIMSDSNGNRSLDFTEFDRAIIELASRYPPSAFSPHDSQPASMLVAPPPAGKRVPVYIPGGEPKRELPTWFLERDKNQDGQIGIGEWPSNQLVWFDRIDTNGDGFITPEEAMRVGEKLGDLGDPMIPTEEISSGD